MKIFGDREPITKLTREMTDLMVERINIFNHKKIQNNINVVNHFSDFAEGTVFLCPGLVEMQKACLNGEANCVLINDAGRISRKMEDFLMFLSEMNSMGVKIVIPRQKAVLSLILKRKV